MRVSKTIIRTKREGKSAPYVVLEACAVHNWECHSQRHKNPRPCNCGAAELWEQVKDRLTLIVEQTPSE